ncbi:MAG TPA: ZIP family metal transporter [Acidimicrobiia bacterium]|nr:ZIP family metal transporter [Acidimicrobiia bacterium]
MSTPEILGLGAIAGLTIFLGLPIGRLRSPAPRTQAFLNAVAIGILVFLVFDVLEHANETVETALTHASDGDGSWWRFAMLAAIFAAGVGIGLLSLVYYDRWLARRRRARFGPGAMAVEELHRPAPRKIHEPAYQLATFIALGIGLHNFSEGLAIGQSAARGEISLALVLIIGFGLHNATEGFGIVGPLAAEGERASWGFLTVMGLIGGGPTFLGTLVGQSFVNDELFLAFLALAAGSIIYVVVQLVQVAHRLGHKEWLMWGLFLGLVLGFATDYVLVAAGA